MCHLQRWELRDITSLVLPIALTLYRASAVGQGQAAFAVAGFLAVLLADSLGAVSYTHLDVYKRQHYQWN